MLFQSTLPAWGATVRTNIDICHSAISIHAPRVGSDQKLQHQPVGPGKFQSTLPVWGATKCLGPDCRRCENFNPRSPCGERPTFSIALERATLFQSTLPVWGATASMVYSGCFVLFQSTLPVWGATEAIARSGSRYGISIHAPRVGSDVSDSVEKEDSKYFNPRSPCGERPTL